jgi:choline-sulfatase
MRFRSGLVFLLDRARRLPIKYLLPAFMGLILAVCAIIFFGSSSSPPRPNIILISLDTLRADRLGCYGCPSGTSPNIDAFSRDSVQFMQAISQARSTTTSHMSLFTGLLPPVHRVSSLLRNPDQVKRFGLFKLGKGIPPLAQYLKRNGYQTVGLHNGGLVSSFFGFDHGFDIYTEKLIGWMQLHKNPSRLMHILKFLGRAAKARKPLFLFLHTYICHAPYIKAPQGIRERFLPRAEPGFPVPAIPPGRSFWSMFHAFWNAVDGSNEAHRRQVRALYDAEVNYADWVVGRIMALLKTNGYYDKTLIAIVSDHGEEFWEHGNTGHKSLFIESLHVPLLIKFPGGEYAGKKIVPMVGQFDLMPTLLEYLRITPRLKLQARSLLPLIRGEEALPRRILSFDDTLRFVRFNQGRFAYANGILHDPGQWLYDTADDPGEQHNLAADRPQIVEQMRSLATQIMKEQQRARFKIISAAPAARTLPEDLKKQIEALGYL